MEIKKSDNLGIISSSLCLIHCLATPFIFALQSCAVTCCSLAPPWWRMIDYLFILISFFAVFISSRQTSNHWIKYMLWTCWSVLLFTVAEERLHFGLLPKGSIYVPALGLIFLHWYNIKYCQCNETQCCLQD